MATRKTRHHKKSYTKPLKSKKRAHEKDLINPQTQWDAYQAIEGQIYAAWKNLENDVARGAHPSVLLEDRNRLMLLLGECNYMAREWMNWANYHPKKRWK